MREKGRSGLVLAALVTIAAVSFGLWALLRPAAPPTTTRLSIALPPGQELAGYHPLAISRDGSRIVYAARDAEGSRLYLRSVDEFEPRLLDGTEGADQPFFSPDGEWVAFFAPGKIQRISVEGGNPILIAEAAGGGLRGGAWGEDDTIIFVSEDSSGLLRVPVGGDVLQAAWRRQHLRVPARRR